MTNESSLYAIQFEKSPDVDNKSTILVFVWYNFQKDVHEDTLCILLLPTKNYSGRTIQAFEPLSVRKS